MDSLMEENEEEDDEEGMSEGLWSGGMQSQCIAFRSRVASQS